MGGAAARRRGGGGGGAGGKGGADGEDCAPRGARGRAQLHALLRPFQDADVAGALAALRGLEGGAAARDASGRLALHCAAAAALSARHVRVLQAVLGATDEALGGEGRGVDERDADGLTPLHYAAGFGCAPGVAALMQAGADANARDGRGRSPLEVALDALKEASGASAGGGSNRGAAAAGSSFGAGGGASRASLAAAASMLSRRESLAVSAAARGDLAALDALLEHQGAGNDDKGGVLAGALHASVTKGHLVVVERLLGAGACARTVVNGATPLMLAARHARTRIARVLLDAGADASKAVSAMTALVAATAGADTREAAECVTLLCSSGASPNAVGAAGVAAPHCAAGRGRPLMLRAMLCADGGADPNVRDARGATPLHHAARAGETQCARVLLEAGADLRAQDHKGRTALDEARAHAHAHAQTQTPPQAGEDASRGEGRDTEASEAGSASTDADAAGVERVPIVRLLAAQWDALERGAAEKGLALVLEELDLGEPSKSQAQARGSRACSSGRAGAVGSRGGRGARHARNGSGWQERGLGRGRGRPSVYLAPGSSSSASASTSTWPSPSPPEAVTPSPQRSVSPLPRQGTPERKSPQSGCKRAPSLDHCNSRDLSEPVADETGSESGGVDLDDSAMDREAGAVEGAQAATNTGAGCGAPDASGGNDAHGVPGATPDASSDSQQEQDVGGDWQTRMSRRRRYRASRQARHDSAASTASASDSSLSDRDTTVAGCIATPGVGSVTRKGKQHAGKTQRLHTGSLRSERALEGARAPVAPPSETPGPATPLSPPQPPQHALQPPQLPHSQQHPAISAAAYRALMSELAAVRAENAHLREMLESATQRARLAEERAQAAGEAVLYGAPAYSLFGPGPALAPVRPNWLEALVALPGAPEEAIEAPWFSSGGGGVSGDDDGCGDGRSGAGAFECAQPTLTRQPSLRRCASLTSL